MSMTREKVQTVFGQLKMWIVISGVGLLLIIPMIAVFPLHLVFGKKSPRRRLFGRNSIPTPRGRYEYSDWDEPEGGRSYFDLSSLPGRNHIVI